MRVLLPHTFPNTVKNIIDRGPNKRGLVVTLVRLHEF